MDIVPFSAALDMAKAEHIPLSLAVVPFMGSNEL